MIVANDITAKEAALSLINSVAIICKMAHDQDRRHEGGSSLAFVDVIEMKFLAKEGIR